MLVQMQDCSRGCHITKSGLGYNTQMRDKMKHRSVVAHLCMNATSDNRLEEALSLPLTVPTILTITLSARVVSGCGWAQSRRQYLRCAV